MVKVRKDLTGKVFGRLTVIKQAEDYISPKGIHDAQWICKCNCEQQNVVIVRGYRLRQGITQSCGCIKKEQTIAFNQTTKSKINPYKLNLEDEYGLYGIGYCNNTEREFYFDMDDYDKIKNICWCEIKDGQFSSLVGRIYNGKHIAMHVLIGFKNHDHADRNELNNRKYNLRPASQKENTRNRTKSQNNTSGFIGVSWNKRIEKWIAYIGIDGKNKHIGVYQSKEEAIIARLKAEQKYYKEFAPQRDLFKEYGIIEEE